MSPSRPRGDLGAAGEELLRPIVARYDGSAFDAPPGVSRLRLTVAGDQSERSWDVCISRRDARLEPARTSLRPDAVLRAGAATWRDIAADVRAGMAAFGARRLRIRGNLHLAVGFLAATAAAEDGRLLVHSVPTRRGTISTLEAGRGEPLLLLHGLGATKASFLPTVAALAGDYRVIAADLPGFGDSHKPFPAPYDAPFLARSALRLLDTLGLERVHLAGHSLGGRVALELGFRHPERLRSLTLITPSMAWRRTRPWAPWLRLVRPELGFLQPAPRILVEPLVRRLVPGGQGGWTAVAVDEFLRAFSQPRGRAAFYAAARAIYLEDSGDEAGFWNDLRHLTPPALFIWGRHDQLVPIGFERHAAEAAPRARHVELDCGHVPQLECPQALHAAMRRFLAAHRERTAAA